ncbi:hypothetical protein A2631_03435 [Candidatus Daviesbacteria bacterium RIFCSPHIGHO2_01_FULL_44_29]|uniref:Uncharacterized protein n=1 Tax=Candidatus Daviesbacteria bacterium RIFCSPHIGHO2_02_FULL_43_12 TaxID=1797776 RepID=A0A1F5KFM2_9BACT|nr:MAG: hypothetical protein A2631_03435 [Candidatus Daviesbacteria bacterium RIFCSPHIGHO2_01_FULL_44_29]OGE38849.1 MAG: hypothetical protein A3E86_02950 [Candidatus Daviesbacteria bacterium RIFCSPHIGHO2_12_FULL_47_45]OGE39746.1 MAG: hypothetical protein A3D25_03390 [Candidatus Daviesbacteria bacterium RIFCSPHIGHO2_02_FULL_43_12]OGE69963.1 MAG: hypothetical protein A3B55_04700 [Candidatus Daviesbacteria bacterium RIFCSPLOWO2_01_FULL_43_15]
MNIKSQESILTQLKVGLEKILTKELLGIRPDINWFSYAKLHQQGFKVKMNSSKKYVLLHKVANKAASRYPGISKGRIAHFLSELVLRDRDSKRRS